MTLKYTPSPTSPNPALATAAATLPNPALGKAAATSPNPAPSSNAPPSYYQSPMKPDNFFYVFLLYR